MGSRNLPTLLVPGSLRAGDGAPVGPTETPLAYIQGWLRRRMPEFGGRDTSPANRVLVVRAETGSGKSTILPVGVFRLLRSERTPASVRFSGAGVICTQPRVLTAIALATDVSAARQIGGATVRINPDMVLGETVGFQTGPVSNAAPSGLLYATAGVLAVQLRNMEDGEFMERYRFILVDEAHERSLDSDALLMLLRNFFERNAGNPRLPFLLLTSATFDTARYAEYFGVGPANVVEVAGRAFPITTHWPAQGTNDYPAEAAATVLRLHEAHLDDPPARADVLVFMPGAAEATAVVAALLAAQLRFEAEAAAGADPARGAFLVLTLNREVVISQTGDFPLVFAPPASLPAVNGRRPVRRVVVATTVAETGLTIDTLRYVVDCGWSRTMELYPPEGVTGLLTRPAPRSRIKQRQGRAGRLFPGDFFPLYTEKVHAALDEQQLPEILATGPAELYLTFVREQQRQKLRTGRVPEYRVEDLALLDPPPPESLLAANATAVALGFVAPRTALPRAWPPASIELLGAAPADGSVVSAAATGYGLTPLGHLAALFARVPMEGARILLAGPVWDAATSDLLTAVAMFTVSLPDLLSGRGRTRKGAAPSALPPGAAALRAALPSFLVARTMGGGGGGDSGDGAFGGGGAVGGGVTGITPPSESEAFYFRARLILGDDFAEAVLLYDAFAARIALTKGDLAAAAAWCEDVGLSFEAMLGVARRRDDLINDLIVAGINPFRALDRRLSVLPAAEFTAGLRAFKRCLYDGLRGRLLRYDPGTASVGPAYVSAQGLRVRTPSLFTDAMAGRLQALHVTPGPADTLRPVWILTDQLRLMPAPQRENDAAPPFLYVAETNLVSVMDGFVDPDPGFGGPRAFAA